MISKKSRKVVAALLIGATVCASGTFAYFNSTVDMSKISGKGTAIQELNITNGYIKVTGTINGTSSTGISDWSYDVARKTTDESLAEGTVNQEWKNAIKTDLGSAASAETAATTVDYITKNQSPDIKGFEGSNTSGTRVPVGSPLTGTVTQARPGDAIVLGDATDSNKQGISIVNESNLTCKARIKFKDNDTANPANSTLEQLKGMAKVGWVMYVNDTKIDLSVADGGLTQINNLLATSASELIGAGKTTTIKVRFELPLLSDNEYQSATNMTEKADGTGEYSTSGAFNLSDLLDIVVTQENNPGWNNDGTTTHPATSTPNNGVTP